MSKIFLIFFLVFFSAFVSSQPGPKVSKLGQQVISTLPTWNCAFNFTFNNATIFSETLSNTLPFVERSNFTFANDNKIDAFNWNGSSCFCWVLLYEDALFNDNRLGLWVGTPTGFYDLENLLAEDTDLNFFEEVELNADNIWNQWDIVLSSYRIYCF